MYVAEFEPYKPLTSFWRYAIYSVIVSSCIGLLGVIFDQGAAAIAALVVIPSLTLIGATAFALYALRPFLWRIAAHHQLLTQRQPGRRSRALPTTLILVIAPVPAVLVALGAAALQRWSAAGSAVILAASAELACLGILIVRERTQRRT